ncbi:MAG: hypothetical protein ACLQHF_05300 [Terracidiphilus sp.]
MKFKAVDFSNVPAFGEVAARLGRIAPTSMPEKAGKDFDTDIYRIYVKKPSEDSIPIDLGADLLANIRDNPEGDQSRYTKELRTQLDGAILGAFRRAATVRP